MNRFGNIQRICLFGWVLAALMIGGINFHQFMMVDNQPLSGYSQTIKMLQANLQQFDRTVADGLFTLASQIELPIPSTLPPNAKKAAKTGPVSIDPNAAQVDASESIILPSLAGIMHVVGADGAIYFQALLNGQLCRTKDKIDGFTVVKISPEEVVVRRSGLKWNIESPSPYYSSDQGN